MGLGEVVWVYSVGPEPSLPAVQRLPPVKPRLAETEDFARLVEAVKDRVADVVSLERRARDALEVLVAEFRTGGVELQAGAALPSKHEVGAQRLLFDGRHRSPHERAAWINVVKGRTGDGSLRALLVGLLMELAPAAKADALAAARAGASDPDWRVRLAVAENAWKLGAEARAILSAMQEDRDADVRDAVESAIEDDGNE